MIKTGRPINFLLGQGDESLSNLLGGGRGEAGDVVLFGNSGGPRFFPSGKDKILAAAYSSGTKSTSSSGGGGGGPSGTAGRPRYNEK